MLMVATRNGHLNIVKFLVNTGANIEESDNYDQTSLSHAAYAGNLSVVEFLVAGGANIEVQNDAKFTPLLEASCAKHIEVVKFLIDKGADVSVKDKDGNTLFELLPEDSKNEIKNYIDSFSS